MHEVYIERCLELAEQGRRLVGNGAMVGAVLVRDGLVLAEGYHQSFGMPHAERELLQKYEQKISSKDVLYVNLEPCCHHGKTPPCTDIIIEKGIKNVFIGMEDPDARMAGKGIERLREAGVNVNIVSSMRERCLRFNRGFASVRTKNRPWITLKQARMQDGRIANVDGSPLKITSEKQNAWSHRNLRAKHDAILVGVQTVMNDDPSLTIRYREEKNMNNKFDQLWRIVLDPTGRIPESSRLCTDENRTRTIVIMDTARPDPKKAEMLQGRGVRVHSVSMQNMQEVFDALMTPVGDFPGLTSVLVEGGAKTWERFREVGVVDEEVILMGA